MLNKTTRSLVKQYGISEKKIKLIPHGCPDVPLVPSSKVKPVLGLKNRVVLSTFGLLSKGKGIEYAIQALPEIIKNEPRIVYYVLGVTHPQVKKTMAKPTEMLNAYGKKPWAPRSREISKPFPIQA